LAATRDCRASCDVLDPNPLPDSQQDIGDAVRQIAIRAFEAARALVCQRIRDVFNEGPQADVGGPNQQEGPKPARRKSEGHDCSNSCMTTQVITGVTLMQRQCNEVRPK
jgi:hypothetical protein